MTDKEILDDIRTKPTVPLWPHAGWAFGRSRGATYAAAKNGDIDVIRMGRSIRAVTAPMRKRLGIDTAG